ncbi:MAG: MarR family winged helix-turn-helix transcriptional regulator [Ktedonobacterales bacterium]
MSRGSHETRAEALKQLALELRQFQRLSASFYRAAAGRAGMTVTDMEVIDSLAAMGPTTAGQLADLTGLTTGAITGMLNRLEEAGVVRRERDPEDGRRVIVRIVPDTESPRAINTLLDSVSTAWDELAALFDDEQVALLRDFLKRGNAISRQDILQLREAPEGERGIYSTPLDNVVSGQLVISGASQLTVRAGDRLATLYQARFEGPAPEVKASDGVVAIRYQKRLWGLGAGDRAAEVTLNAAIPWQITVKGGASVITAELGGLNLAGLEVKGGMSMISLDLPAPSGMVPILIGGGASQIIIQRPADVAARVHLMGWASAFRFDDQNFSNMGSDVRLQSSGYDATAPGYDIKVSSSASMVTITAG